MFSSSGIHKSHLFYVQCHKTPKYVLRVGSHNYPQSHILSGNLNGYWVLFISKIDDLQSFHLYSLEICYSLVISIVNLRHSELIKEKQDVLCSFLPVHQLISLVYVHMFRQVKFLCDTQEIV